MIFAFDEGAWHPNENVVYAWAFLALLSLVSQALLAATGRRRTFYYVAFALPVVGLFAYNAYVSYGSNGMYMGGGSIGPGAKVDWSWACEATAVQLAFCSVPTWISVLLAHWRAFRRRVPRVFGVVFVVLAIMQLACGLVLVVVLLNDH